jgi:hypothetical protein
VEEEGRAEKLAVILLRDSSLFKLGRNANNPRSPDLMEYSKMKNSLYFNPNFKF